MTGVVRFHWIVLAGMAALVLTPLHAEVTFNKDVLPILQKNCQNCHRPGEVAPMSFLTYESTRPWAKAMKTAVLTRKMPPWFADPQYGHFANEKRLTESEINTIVAWADHGAPEGDPQDKPAAVAFTPGWTIKPDVIVGMPKSFPIPAKGVLELTHFIVPSGFTKDTPGSHSNRDSSLRSLGCASRRPAIPAAQRRREIWRAHLDRQTAR